MKVNLSVNSLKFSYSLVSLRFTYISSYSKIHSGLIQCKVCSNLTQFSLFDSHLAHKFLLQNPTSTLLVHLTFDAIEIVYLLLLVI